MMLLAPFPSCCCYEFWLPFPPATAEAFATAAAGPRMGKTPWKKSPPGRETPSIEPQNSRTSLLKP